MDLDVVVDRDGDGDDGSNFCPRPPIPGDMLSFQKLEVYKCSVEFVAVAIEVCVWMPKGHAALSDQLRRAAFSVPLNIAEAAGRTSQADAARHYAIASGSAMESAAIFEVVRCLSALRPEQDQRGLELLARIVAMLTKLCR